MTDAKWELVYGIEMILCWRLRWFLKGKKHSERIPICLPDSLCCFISHFVIVFPSVRVYLVRATYASSGCNYV